ncbi:S8 family serine peptidase [Chloroflexi bacterium TSY]|nr:S8 family serine peptidase [Chloroflexi bacterium TSY]
MRFSLTFIFILALTLTLFPHPYFIQTYMARPLFAQSDPKPTDPEPLVNAASISSYLQEQLLLSDGPVSFLVILDEQPELASISAQVTSASRSDKATLLYRQLVNHAETSQAPLRAWLDARGIPYRPFYIVNMIEVLGDADVVYDISQRPDVNRLAANPKITLKTISEHYTDYDSISSDAYRSYHSWLDAIALQEERIVLSEKPPTERFGWRETRAHEVWADGYKGQGVVVASQDTGVEWNHPALKKQYRGWNAETESVEHQYNWFDVFGSEGRPLDRCDQSPQVPCDDHHTGHGTHTVGTMVGDSSEDGGAVLGMAPEAKWIGCRNMNKGVGTPESYTECFQFFLAPYPQGGDPFKDGRPDLAPHIINNSWGCPEDEHCDPNTLRQIVKTVRAAGQLIVASAGNDATTSNPCSTVSNPIAIYDDVYTVGAYNDIKDDIASFSSRGPVMVIDDSGLKPDIVAPGKLIYSTKLNGSYGHSSGTSMASPHVAGAAALLWSAVPHLVGEIDLTEMILSKSAQAKELNECSDAEHPVSPNHTFGYGYLDAKAAVDMALNPARANIAVHDCDETRLAGALVSLTDQRTGYTYTELTDANGIAAFPTLYAAPVADEFQVTAQAGTAKFTHKDFMLLAGIGVTQTLQATSCTQRSTVTVHLQGVDSIPIGTVRVFLRNLETNHQYEVDATSDGKALFTNVYQGKYVVERVVTVGTVTLPPFEPVDVEVSPNSEQEVIMVAQRDIYMPIFANK